MRRGSGTSTARAIGVFERTGTVDLGGYASFGIRALIAGGDDLFAEEFAETRRDLRAAMPQELVAAAESSAGALAQLRLVSEVDGTGLLGIEASFHEVLGETYLHFALEVENGRYAPPTTRHLATAIDWKRLEMLAHTKQSLRI